MRPLLGYLVAFAPLTASACSLRDLDRLLTSSGQAPDAAADVDGGAPEDPCVPGELCARAVAAGESHTCAALRDGRVLCWGANSARELGVPIIDRSNVPVEVTTGEPAVAVAVGGTFSCARSLAGGVRCWGAPTYGQLGAADPPGPNDNAPPRAVVLEGGGTPLGNVAALSIGRYHAFAVSEGRLLGWGLAERTGNMAFAAEDLEVRAARPIVTPVPVDQISAGYTHGCLLSRGSLFCFGTGYEGQLAALPSDGGTTAQVPIAATLLTGRSFTRICASTAAFSCAVESSGTLVCWGSSAEGATGNDAEAPFDVTSDVVDVSCRGETTCAIKRDGSVVCFGNGERGRLGRGSTTKPTLDDARRPQPVVGLAPVSRISVGETHSCAVLRSGGVRCWGANDTGQLGDGTSDDRGTPVPPKIKN